VGRLQLDGSRLAFAWVFFLLMGLLGLLVTVGLRRRSSSTLLCSLWLVLGERLLWGCGELGRDQAVHLAGRGRQLRHEVLPEEFTSLLLLVGFRHSIQLHRLDVVNQGQDGQGLELHLL